MIEDCWNGVEWVLPEEVTVKSKYEGNEERNYRRVSLKVILNSISK